MPVTRQQCDAMFTELGEAATFEQVADRLGCSPNTVRRRYTHWERKRFCKARKRVHRAAYLAREAAKVRAYHKMHHKVPTARQAEAAGVNTHAMKALGGYAAIVAAAGFTPRKPGRPKWKAPPSHPQPDTIQYWQDARGR